MAPNVWDKYETGFEGRFKQSLVDRAKKRMVRKLGDSTWQVMGDAKLGDAYEEYTVRDIGGASAKGKSNPQYYCSCFEHKYGDKRQRKTCSHILAVMLYRRRKEGQGLFNEPI